jgi:hypothetical protein
LARGVEVATGALARQGEVAARAGRGGRSGGGGSGGGHGGGGHGALGMLPFAGPAIEHGAIKYFETGASVEQQIAMLRAMGATPQDIARAQADWRELSKSYAGVSQSDFLAGYRQARTQVSEPGEAFEMATAGAKYRLALRNSGISASDTDVESVIKILDEFGLKTPAARDDFINQMVKTQQAFGDQIKPETYLAAIRNAGQSIYGWSPQFKNSFLPTILQSMGERGGTQIATAFNNWVGGHLSHAELKAMAAAGFVDPKDLMYNKVGDVKGIKPGAHMYKADLFKSDIATWAWQFHSDYLKRKGATEGGFDDLIARMPRNMASLIAFLVHNEGRIKRDAETRDLAIGSAAAGNGFLGANPVAGMDALKTSLESFLSVVSQPAMKTVGANLEATAAALQKLAAIYGKFAHDNPDAAAKIGLAAGGGAAAAGGYLSWKMISGMGRFFGFGGGGAAGGAGAAGGGLFGALVSKFGALGAVIGLTQWLDPSGNFGGATSGIDEWFKKHFGFDPSNVPLKMPTLGHPTQTGGAAARSAADFQRLFGVAPPASVQVSGQATVTVPVKVEVTASSSLLQIIQRAEGAAHAVSTTIPLNPVAGGHSGRMDSDAAPLRNNGVWDR